MNTAKQFADELITQSKAMQLATQDSGNLWICTLTPAVGEDWTIYWVSQKTARHSVELTANQSVAVAMVRDPSVRQGIQMQGTAAQVTNEELIQAHKIFCKRYGDRPELLTEAQSPEKTARTYYKFTPTTVVMFDTVNFPKEPRQQIL